MSLTVVKALRQVAFAMFAVAVAGSANAAEITGAGATFPNPVYQKWAEAYKAKSGNSLNYQSVGSGAGVTQIRNKTVDFGATDNPMKEEDQKAAGLVQFPAVIGGIVPVFNLPGLGAGQLKLDGPTLANIFMGLVKTWDAAPIAKLNPGVKLPSTPITVVHRSDGSGTSFNFTFYLSAVNADWQSKVGAANAVDWPAGVGGKGNEGVAALVQQTTGSIGYVELAYALQNKMAYTQMQNRDGYFVSPTLATFQAAAANAKWETAPGYYLILVNQPGKDSWPITAATFILVYGKPATAERTKAVLDFFGWAFHNGQKLAEDLLYVPLPDALIKQIEETWKSDVKVAQN